MDDMMMKPAYVDGNGCVDVVDPSSFNTDEDMSEQEWLEMHRELQSRRLRRKEDMARFE